MDREILISIKMLRKWDLVHPMFPHETVRSYFKRQIKNRKVASIFKKSSIPSKVRVSEVPTECELLRKKILAKHQEIFKEKLASMIESTFHLLSCN